MANNLSLGMVIALIKKLGGGGGDIDKAIADYIAAHTNIADGIAGLDAAGQVAPAQLPDRNHQLVLPYVVELTSEEMANAIDDKTEDYGTIAIGQIATPTTNDVFVVGHLYQYVSEEGVYNWNDLSDSFQAKNLSFTNTSVAASLFADDTTYADLGFSFKATVPLTGVTQAMYPIASFSLVDAMSGNYAPTVESYNGGIYIWAKTKPDTALVIPRIEVIK
nr:MAG TPA: hypothetical protein [Caudoviricetes sp.]